MILVSPRFFHNMTDICRWQSGSGKNTHVSHTGCITTIHHFKAFAFHVAFHCGLFFENRGCWKVTVFCEVLLSNFTRSKKEGFQLGSSDEPGMLRASTCVSAGLSERWIIATPLHGIFSMSLRKTERATNGCEVQTTTSLLNLLSSKTSIEYIIYFSGKTRRLMRT